MPASARELAEALWLAEHLAAADTDPAAGAHVSQRMQSDGLSERRDAAIAPGDGPPVSAKEPQRPRSTEPRHDALVRQHMRGILTEGSSDKSLLPLALPTPREIQQPLAYIRALRALRQTLPSRRRRILNEAATARRSAEIERPFPVWQPEPERFFDLLIVVDHGPSMLFWKQLVFELRAVLRPLAAFRTIRTKPLADHLASARSAAGDLSERLVVLVLSDCVGPEWRDASAQRMLASLGSRSPVAVLNPLPRRLWDRTAVGTGELLLRAHRRAQPNRTLQVLHADPGWRTDATGGIPVPLIGLDCDDVAAWADLVSGRAGNGAWVTVLADGEAAAASPERARTGSAAWSSPVEAVAEFSRSAAPAAFTLAGMLATAPLTLPTMRAVQYLTEQKFGSAHLAEVFLSGLIERSDSGHDSFDFAPGVRRALLATVRRSDAAWLVNRLDEWISRNMAIQSASFKAFIESAHGVPSTVGTADYVPFASIPREVLQSLGGGYAPAEPETRERWNTKLLVLGQGAAGKTSLVKRLLGEPFDHFEATTHGLGIVDLLVPHPERVDTTMTLSTWDFGGQQIYHATHQFFLTDEACCLLVWNSRADWKSGRLRYWLDVIAARMPKSPVLVVATHIGLGDRAPDLPADELRLAYPQIVGFAMVDNMSGEGIEALRTTISTVAAELPLMGARWPIRWLDAMQAVVGSPEPYVTSAWIWRTMAEAGLVDRAEQLHLARAMHKLGSILYFEGEETLAEFVILSPEWLAGYIARVLDSPQVAVERGVLRRPHLRELWGDLDSGLREHLLELMDRFDLSYRMGGEFGDDAVSLVVERLPWSPPDNWPEVWDRAVPGEADLRIRVIYQMHGTPPGIPSWFIARSHRFSTGTHWRTGAVLAHPDGLHRGLILSDLERNFVELAVRGPAPASFAAVLEDLFDQVLRRYPGLGVSRKVPCQCREGCPHLFDYADLQRRTAHIPPLLTIQCPYSLEEVYVPRLLLGLLPSSRDELRGENDRIDDDLDG